MANKKMSINKRQAALIREARAGLIPESDWIVEEVRARIKRTARVSRVITSHAKRLTRGSDVAAISEILADLRHYCDIKGLPFEELNTIACENYLDETSQSCMVGSLEG